jgi:hypothetical protein
MQLGRQLSTVSIKKDCHSFCANIDVGQVCFQSAASELLKSKDAQGPGFSETRLVITARDSRSRVE